MNNTVTFIYLLKDPITLDIKYIGKSDDPNNRLTEHIRKSKYKNTYKNNWINGLLESGNLPIMEIIDVVVITMTGLIYLIHLDAEFQACMSS